MFFASVTCIRGVISDMQCVLQGLLPTCVSIWPLTGLNGIRVFDLPQLLHGLRRVLWILVSLPYLRGFIVNDLLCLLHGFLPARVSIWSSTDLNGVRVVDLQPLLQGLRPALLIFPSSTCQSDLRVSDLQQVIQGRRLTILAPMSLTCHLVIRGVAILRSYGFQIADISSMSYGSHTVANKLIEFPSLTQRISDYVMVPYMDIILTTMVDVQPDLNSLLHRL